MKVLPFFATLLIASLSPLALGLEDTPENRETQADRYLEVNSPQEIFKDIAERTKDSLPNEEQQPFIDMLTKHLDVDALSVAMKTSMIKHFTADEISALADFYSLPGAKSAMSKMNTYLSEVIPVVQEEMIKAQEKAFHPSIKQQFPDSE